MCELIFFLMGHRKLEISKKKTLARNILYIICLDKLVFMLVLVFVSDVQQQREIKKNVVPAENVL